MGIGILLRDSIKFKQTLLFQSSAFENYQLTFRSGGVTVRVAVACRLHPAKKNGQKFSDLFREYVDSFAICSGHLYIANTKHLSSI